MIQRIQTLFLLAVSICMGMVLSYPIWTEVDAGQTRQIVFTATKMDIVALPYDASGATLDHQATWYIAALAVLASLIALISIFQFKNRLTQMKLGALNALIMAATLGLSYYKVYQFEPIVNPQGQGAFLLGFFFPVAAMIFNILANRFIRRDEKLVRSVDRIR